MCHLAEVNVEAIFNQDFDRNRLVNQNMWFCLNDMEELEPILERPSSPKEKKKRKTQRIIKCSLQDYSSIK